jgi:hypothetical protein
MSVVKEDSVSDCINNIWDIVYHNFLTSKQKEEGLRKLLGALVAST